MSTGDEVAIAGRVFTFGAAYAPRDPRSLAAGYLPRRLLGHDPAFPWPGGRVEVLLVPSAAYCKRTTRKRLSGRAWAAWAGGEVGR